MATRFFPNYGKNLIISRFGMRKHPITKVNRMHNGIDINATSDGKTGQVDYITAHTGGVVEAVGYGVSAGNYIKIRVDPQTLMVYYHMKSKSALKKGDLVAQGQRVGYVGKTGSATGPHLHWGIQHNGEWIDPEPYLDADWAQQVQIGVSVLGRGDKGPAVAALQALLNLRQPSGVPLELDGSFGSKTQAAVKTYQSAKGLTDTGTVAGEEWSALIHG